MEALPEVAQVDLAVVEDASGRLVPRLIELQGFPSLSAFEVLQSDVWNECLKGIPGLPETAWSPYFSGLSRDGFLDLFRRTIVGRTTRSASSSSTSIREAEDVRRLRRDEEAPRRRCASTRETS